MFITFMKAALYQITNHCHEFFQRVALRRHLRIVAESNEPSIFLLDLEDQFFLHGLILICDAIQVNAQPSPIPLPRAH